MSVEKINTTSFRSGCAIFTPVPRGAFDLEFFNPYGESLGKTKIYRDSIPDVIAVLVAGLAHKHKEVGNECSSNAR